MSSRGVRDESGQALVIAAMGAFVLAAALVLTIDWGYALLQRRIVQNDADKVALAVARLLATSVAPYQTTSFRFAKAGSSSSRENLTHRELCTTAKQALQRDPGSRTLTLVGAPMLWIDLEQWDPDSPSPNPSASVRANCASAQSRSVDRRTTTVRVRIERRYKTLYAGLLRQSDVIVGATARAALTGAPFIADPAPDALPANPTRADYAELARSAVAIRRTWPIVRRYSSSELTSRRPCGPACDPTQAGTPFRFATGSSLTSGVQLVDLSRDSSRTPGLEQVITEPYPGTASLADAFGQPFGGVLGLETDWNALLPFGQDAVPVLDTDRPVCDGRRWLLGVGSNGDAESPPSCEVGAQGRVVGDWVETLHSDTIGSDLVGRMRALIGAEGITTQFSGLTIPTSTSSSTRNGGNQFGKALVVWIYLWDCAQDFNDQGKWAVGAEGGPDCSPSPTERHRVDRVHLFTVVPITFYEGLVTPDAIEAYWGGGFVDPGRCQTAPGSCPTITALANSAFLIADDSAWDPTVADAAGEDDPDEELEPPDSDP